MARVLYTAAVAAIRGKLAGSVFTRNKGGEIIRTKVTPINPKTSYQSGQRAIVSDLAKAYSGTLTADERTAWTSFGQSTNAKSIFGNALILSGIAAFQKLNILIITAGGTMITSPPIGQTVVSITSASLLANHTGPLLTLTFTPTPIITPSGTYIWATPALPAGISNYNSRLRFIGFTDAAASPLELHAAWIARFGAFPSAAGQLIGVKAQVLDLNTGAISSGTQLSTLVI